MSSISHHLSIVSRGRCSGLSLVELMVALTVGMVLLGGLLQVWSSSRQTYRFTEAQSRAQENGRYATQMLASELRATRSIGCRSIALEEYQDSLNVIACDLLNPGDSQTGCQGDSAIGTTHPMGYDGSQAGDGWLAGLPGTSGSGAEQSVSRRWLRGDVFVSWGGMGDGLYVNTPSGLDDQQQGTINLPDDVPTDLGRGDLALITDCEGTDVFEITSADDPVEDDPEESANHPAQLRFAAGSTTNIRSQMSRTYNRQGTILSPGTTIRARIFPFEYKVYYICCADTVDTDDARIQVDSDVDNCKTGGDASQYRPALCRWSSENGGSTRQLVGDIADMQVTYSGVNGATAFHDLDADDVDDWSAVQSIRVQLLATNGEEVLSAAASPGDCCANAGDLGAGMADDRRAYQVFSLTVAARASSPWFVE